MWGSSFHVKHPMAAFFHLKDIAQRAFYAKQTQRPDNLVAPCPQETGTLSAGAGLPESCGGNAGVLTSSSDK